MKDGRLTELYEITGYFFVAVGDKTGKNLGLKFYNQ